MPHKHLFMGAVNKTTKDYIFPIHAHKNCEYICPKCKNDITFKCGKINTPHFAHKKNSVCCYYSSPSESEIHKEGKKLIKKLFDNKQSISISRAYNCCKNTEEVFKILNNEYTDDLRCVEEYRFTDSNGKNKYADVALLKGDTILFIFEIYHTHKTSEERQTNYDWCEIDATILIDKTMKHRNLTEDCEIKIDCVRDVKCRKCMLRKFVNKKIKCNNRLIIGAFWKMKREWLDYRIIYEWEKIVIRRDKAEYDAWIFGTGWYCDEETREIRKRDNEYMEEQKKRLVDKKIYDDFVLKQQSKKKKGKTDCEIKTDRSYYEKMRRLGGQNYRRICSEKTGC